MFIGPWEGGGPWNSRGIEGVHRFLQRVWNLVNETNGNPRARSAGSGGSAGTGERGNAAMQSAPTRGSRSPATARLPCRDGRGLTLSTHTAITNVTDRLRR